MEERKKGERARAAAAAEEATGVSCDGKGGVRAPAAVWGGKQGGNSIFDDNDKAVHHLGGGGQVMRNDDDGGGLFGNLLQRRVTGSEGAKSSSAASTSSDIHHQQHGHQRSRAISALAGQGHHNQFRPCRHCGGTNHLPEDCPYRSAAQQKKGKPPKPTGVSQLKHVF